MVFSDNTLAKTHNKLREYKQDVIWLLSQTYTVPQTIFRYPNTCVLSTIDKKKTVMCIYNNY